MLAIALASLITLNDAPCSTGLTAFCQNPAPSVSSLTYNLTWGRLTVTIDGVQYVSAPYSATAQGGTVYAPDGTWREVSTVFATWINGDSLGAQGWDRSVMDDRNNISQQGTLP